MHEVVMKRHPRRAVWLCRLGEYAVPMGALGVAVVDALTGQWAPVPPWLLVGLIALVYQRRLEHAWLWGWRSGHDEGVRRMMPYVRLEDENLRELHDVLAGEAPTWRQRQDELAQMDAKATMRATLEQLEKQWADSEGCGPQA